jgi:hypothetical protein
MKGGEKVKIFGAESFKPVGLQERKAEVLQKKTLRLTTELGADIDINHEDMSSDNKTKTEEGRNMSHICIR